MTDTAAARRRGAARDHPARAPRRGVLVGAPLPDLERARDRAAGRGEAEHGGLPAARRRASGSTTPASARATRELVDALLADFEENGLRERGWTKVDLGQGPVPARRGRLRHRDRPRGPARALRAAGRGGGRRAGERFPLALVTPKTHLFLNSTFANQRRQHSAQPRPELVISPEDAAARGIEDGAPGARVQRPRRLRAAPPASPTTPAPACSWRRWAGGTATTPEGAAPRPRRRSC